MKKKNKLFTPGVFVAFILLFLIGGISGYVFASLGSSLVDGYGALEYALVFLGIVFAFVFSIITHELGHLFYGWLSGYGFVSFRVFGVMLIKGSDGLKFKRYSLAGTGGQCLMVPPDMKDGKIPIILYNLGGVIVNLTSGALFLVVYLLLSDIPLLSHLLAVSGQ